MNICIQTLMLGFFVFQAETKTYAASDKLTLDLAKKYAISKNFKLKSLRHEVNAIEAERDAKYSNYMPRAGLVGGVNSYGEIAKEIGPVGYGYVNYNIFNGYRDEIDLELASIDVEKSKLNLSKEEFNIGLAVEKHFHTYIYFSDLIRLQQSSLDLNDNHKSLVKKTNRAGLSSATDVMEFRLKDAIFKSDLELLRQKLEETRSNLKMLLGDELGSKVIPVGEIQHQHLLGSLMTYLERIKKTSLPVKMATLNLKKMNANSSAWKASWFPKVDIEVQAGQLPIESRGEKRETNVSFLLTAKYELFSGFESRHLKRKQFSLLARDESLLKHHILSSITEMETSYRRLKTIEKRVDLEEHSVDRSHSYYKGVKKEYLRGYKNSSDLASAAEGFVESKRRKIEFMYAFLMEKIKLEKSLGAKVDVEIIK